MNRKKTLIITVIGIFFISFVVIYVNKSMENNAGMAGMPGMSQSGKTKKTASTEVEPMAQSVLLKYIKNPNVTIVDLREPVAYKKSHIPNAINIPFEDFQKRYKELDANKQIILVCHVGSMGEASGQMLLQLGFKHVANLTGGMAKWTGPVVTS